MSGQTLRLETAEVFEPLFQDGRYKAAHGGRGSGKSHFFAEGVVEKSILEPGTHVVCIREIQRTLKHSSKKLIENKISAMGVSQMFDVQDKQIITPGNGLIIFEGMQNHNADSIKSLEGFDVAWVEEAQSLSQTSLDLLRPTLRKPKSELWFSWNPKNKTDPVDSFFRGGELPPRTVVVEANYSDNPWFSQTELLEEMEYDKRRDKDKYAHVWLGGYQLHSEARVFKNWKIDSVEIPQGTRPYYGADWGFSVDPTVLIKVYIWNRTLYIRNEAYKVGCDIDHTPALFDTLDDKAARKWQITSDSARPETISYMRKHGYPKIVAAKKGAGSVEDGIEFMKSYDIVVHPDCKHTIDELSLYSYKQDKLTNEILPELEDKKNHVIDACRYAVEGLRRAPGQLITGTYGMANG